MEGIRLPEVSCCLARNSLARSLKSNLHSGKQNCAVHCRPILDLCSWEPRFSERRCPTLLVSTARDMGGICMRANSTVLVMLLVFLLPVGMYADTQRWSEARANAWYAEQPWLVGSNFVPADAINQLEMWQAETFNPQEIDRELGWAEDLGMNTMRVFLHD